uniref:Protein unc-45 homolog B n=1 Tax=Alexandrium monilatum TaxID=311494 RepID=A0A7S4QH08_9DINO
MAPVEDPESSIVPSAPLPQKPTLGGRVDGETVDEWVDHVDEVSAQIRGIIDGTITDFDAFDRQLELKDRAKQIREEEAKARRERFFLYGIEGKGEGKQYKWWCKRCFVEYAIDLPDNKCTRCKQSDQMMTQQARRDELMGKLEVFKEEKAKHQWRKDKWLRWKKSQALLRRSRNINYKAWEYWEPDTDTEEEGEPIVPRDNPEFLAMEADLKQRQKKSAEKAHTAERCRQRGNQCLKEGDYVGAIEHYDEGLEYRRDCKALWTNKALAELKVFRWRDAIGSCNKVIEYAEIFEDGFEKSSDACFKAFVRRAAALRALHKWSEALLDLEDALRLFPKDKEALDLYEKTKASCDEDKQVKEKQEEHQPEASPGPVRVEIEESEDEEDAESLQAVPRAHTNSLGGLGKQEFATLLRKLRGDPSHRSVFCARRGGGGPKASDGETRKVRLESVEEVAEPSGLDGALRDAERCSVLWKKSQGRVVPLRKDVEHLTKVEDEDTPEGREVAAFLRVVTPRVVMVLHALASCSDHHCALTVSAVRHVWPLLSCSTWRHGVLELLLEWSQRSITAKAMAEFAGRNPDPHLCLLLEAVTRETKENLLPPGLEDRAQSASRHLENAQNMDEALEEVFQGLTLQSPAELALSTLGNLCLAGRSLPAFKEHLVPFQDELVDALGRQLRPMNWRLCGRAAGAACNVVRLGSSFAAAVEEKCLEPLVAALRGECAEEGPASLLLSMYREGGVKGPIPGAGATSRLLAALANLLVVRPSAMQRVLALGVLDLVLPLMDPEADLAAEPGSLDSQDEEVEPALISSRAALLASRMLGAAPGSISLPAEAELLRRLLRMLQRAGDASAPRADGARLHQLDLPVRMLAVLLTKTPGALDRLTDAAPRVEELSGEAAAAPAREGPAVAFAELAARLAELFVAIEPEAHVGPDEEGGAASRIRGNLALLFAALCEAQTRDGAPPALRDLSLSCLVPACVGCLRKERGKVQSNMGICLTRLAQNPRYRQQVRDLNGIESLHQIQLPVVEAQKAEASRMHRIETSVEARKAEVQKRRSMHEASTKP